MKGCLPGGVGLVYEEVEKACYVDASLMSCVVGPECSAMKAALRSMTRRQDLALANGTILAKPSCRTDGTWSVGDPWSGQPIVISRSRLTTAALQKACRSVFRRPKCRR